MQEEEGKMERAQERYKQMEATAVNALNAAVARAVNGGSLHQRVQVGTRSPSAFCCADCVGLACLGSLEREQELLGYSRHA